MAVPGGAPREAIPGGWISDIGIDGSAMPRAGNEKGLVKAGGYVAYGGGLSIPVTCVGSNHDPCKEAAIGDTVGYGLYPGCWTALLECVGGAVCIVGLGNIEESTEGGAIFTLAANATEGEIPGGPGAAGVFGKPEGTWYGTGANPIFTVLILGEGKDDIELELVWETCATGTAGDGGSMPCGTSGLSNTAQNWNQSPDT